MREGTAAGAGAPAAAAGVNGFAVAAGSAGLPDAGSGEGDVAGTVPGAEAWDGRESGAPASEASPAGQEDGERMPDARSSAAATIPVAIRLFKFPPEEPL